jgi:BirA family transcriptional regulator, biotin operon repressor / biotin---[acetyl-CoA-carboxylase] ligase
VQALLGDGPLIRRADCRLEGWNAVLVRDTAEGSQFDRLIQLARDGHVMPDRAVCLARTGTGFRGFRRRDWSARTGNIHLTVHFAPGRAVDRFETVFAALAAVSVVEAIDSVPGMQRAAGIKWVNDVLVSGRKVAGVLAHTQTRGDAVTAVVLGIGVNVESTPDVARSAYVPAVGSVRELAPEPAVVSAPRLLHGLLSALHSNYEVLMREGHGSIMDRYRTRSVVLGREVTICEDVADGAADPMRVIAAGRVEAIGDGLELHLAGVNRPVSRGRLLLGGWKDAHGTA